MEKIDVKGLSCPLPVIKTKQLIDKGETEILITGNTGVSKENITRLAQSQGYNVDMLIEDKDNWEMKIEK